MESSAIVAGVATRVSPRVVRLTAPNPGMMTGPGTNAYLIGSEQLALIDPGPAIAEHVEALLDAAGGRLRWVLCTHTHIDHSPAAALVREKVKVEVLGMPPPADGRQDATFTPERVLRHGERLDCGGFTLRAVHTPGHASNHLCYLLEQDRWLFTGDHIMQGSTVVINPPDGDMVAYLRSLELLLGEDLACLAPGHGQLIEAPHEEVRKLIKHRLGREQKVLDAFARVNPATIEELTPIVYADVSQRLHAVAQRSLYAHLLKLAREQRVQEQDGRWRLR